MAARVPVMRFSSRVQIATSFFPRRPSSSSGRRGGHAAGGAPPALTADVRVVIMRHFVFVPDAVVGLGPCGCACGGGGGTAIVAAQKVAADIALRRRASRQLRTPELVERALARDVLPLVGAPLDRAAVAVSAGQICARVSAACASPHVALGGVRVLVQIDTVQRPVVVPVVSSFRRALPPPPFGCKPKPMRSGGDVNDKSAIARMTDDIDLESELPLPAPAASAAAETKRAPRKSVGVIGDRRPVKQAQEPCVDRRFEGWLPW